MAKRGNPRIKEIGFKQNPEKARAAAKRSAEVRREKANTFKTAKALVDAQACDDLLNPAVVKFWAMRGVPKSKITPMMAEIAPIYNDAVGKKDMATLERIYKLFGVMFESDKENNVKVSLANDNGEPLKHDISGGLKITFEEKKPEPIEG